MIRLSILVLAALSLTACEERDAVRACDSQEEPAPPVDPPMGEQLGLSPHVTFTAGLTHQCRIVSSAIECFGSEVEANEHGLLDAPSGTGWVSIDADWWSTCALHEGGHAECWGRLTYTNSLILNVMGQQGLSDFRLGAAGGLALREDGTLRAWGSDVWDQVSATPDGEHIAVETGYGWACAVDVYGQLGCWGIAEGEGATYANPDVVDHAPYDAILTTLRAGSSTVCGIDTDGLLQCWGEDEHGQVSDSTGQPAAQVAPSEHYVAWLDDAGYIHAAGQLQSPWHIDLGRGDVPNPPTSGGWDDIACGHSHCCVSADDGDAECWGEQNMGALDMYGLVEG